MTLQRLLEAGDVEGCLAFFTALRAADRRSHFETVRHISAEMWTRRQEGIPWPGGVHDAVGVALMACATLAELKKLGLWVPTVDVALHAARELRPSWLGDWAQALVEESPRRWLLARRLVRAGLCPRPSSDAYILGMLLTWPLHGEAQNAPRRAPWERLEDDPALLEHEVWRIFEVEGGGEFSLAAVDKYYRPGWQDSLLTLCEHGRLDRSRLLDCSLQALQRDFSQFRASWYSRFHEALKPSLDEREARQSTYVALLHSRIPPTVAFALEALVKLDRAGRLTPDALPTALDPVMDAPQKKVVSNGLALLARAAAQRPRLALDVARRAASALAHPTTDVQSAAWTIIERHGTPDDPALREIVARLQPAIAASLQQRVKAWLGDDHNRAQTPILAGQQRTDAGPLPPEENAPRPLIPVADTTELLDVFARVLEDAADPDAVERVLDGVSRLSDHAIDPRLLAPLLKRASTLRASARSIQRELVRLAHAWGRREFVPAQPHGTLTDLLGRRVTEIVERVVVGRTSPLQALPTHVGGRILCSGHGDPRQGDTACDADRLVATLRRSTWTPVARRPVVRVDRLGKKGEYMRLRVHVSAFPEAADEILWSSRVGDTEAEIRHAATLCPTDLRAFFAQGVTEIGNNLDWWEARWCDIGWLEPLFSPHVALPPFRTADAPPGSNLDEVHTDGLGVLVLVLALASKQQAQQRLAVDALAATLDQGRLDPADAAHAMAFLLGHNYVKPARWAQTLGDAARISPSLARAVAIMIERSIRHAVRKEQAPLLELLHELLIEGDIAPSDFEARGHLERCAVGGKTGRLCRDLCRLFAAAGST